MRVCKAHGEYDPTRQWGCPECIRLLLDIAEAANEEIVFSYSHPMAAERGRVWTEYAKTPKFYRAMKAYWQALEAGREKKSGKRPS